MKRKINSNIRFVFLSVMAVLMMPGLMAQDAHDLLAKLDNIMFAPKDKQGTVEIILIESTGEESLREAELFQKGRDKKLYRYTKPEKQAGIATLSLPDGVMWLYMPAFGNPKKISLLAKSQAFTGTDFSYEDMATEPFAERFFPRLIETRDNIYVLELKPRDERSNYSKIVVYQDVKNYYPKKMEYYDNGGKLFKESSYQYEKIGQYWNAKEVTMTNVKKEHSTKIRLSNVKFDQGLSDDIFTVENLKPGE
ncbi:MAG TPA: outer membrane lipoprotein-sorting protein [Bacteroidales bacterium]|nr:outer membrane lipoprotein-sorting protein [Bacteroidales bacterium]